MNNDSGIRERRQSVRFRVRECALVFNEDHLGEILDISSSGMSFVSRSKQIGDGGLVELNIICSDGYHISQLPCCTVSNYVLPDQPMPVIGDMRRIGVEFLALSPGQRQELESFIRSHALGIA